MDVQPGREGATTPSPLSSRDYQASITALNSTQLHGDSLRRAYSARRATMEAMHIYLKRLGIYDQLATTLPTLHITGSKGKGSTCAFIESILRQQGVKTVLFTSPHLVRVNERIRLNGQPLSNEQWTKHFWAVWDQLQATAPPPPISPPASPTHTNATSDDNIINDVNAEPEAIPGYFRLLTLLCLWVALEEKADVLILEVGVGGRFDATNVIPHPVACAITTLDLEHIELLGDTIEKIAWEKGGIIKPQVPCFVSPQPPKHASQALRVLRECAQEVAAPLYIVEPLLLSSSSNNKELKLGIVGDFQSMNAALAVAVVQQYYRYKSVQKSGGEGDKAVPPAPSVVQETESKGKKNEEEIPIIRANLKEATEKAGLERCSWPGRCQRLDRLAKKEQCIFYIDGAHTQESMRIAIKWFDDETHTHTETQSRRVLIFNCGEEKTVPDILSHLIMTPEGTPRFALVLFCPVASAKPTLAHARPPGVLLLEEGGEEGYARQLGEQGRLRGLCEVVEMEKEKEKERKGEDGGSGGGASSMLLLPWQNALRDTWRVLQAYHTQAQTEAQKEGPSSFATDIQAVDEVTRTMVKPSVAAALEEIQRFALGKGGEDKGKGAAPLPPVQVLATGSLYLVGNVLGQLEEDDNDNQD